MARKQLGANTSNSTDAVSVNGLQVLANKTLTDPKIANDIYDLSGNKVFGLVTAGASAVNYMYVTNANTGGGPYFNAASAVDTDVNIGFAPKGAGLFYFYQPTGATAKFQMDGTATDVNLNLATKGAGKVQANAVEVATISATQTITNKWVQPRIVSITSSATPTIDVTVTDQYNITALAANITSLSTTGTAVDGQRMMVRIKGAASQTIVWNTSNFLSSGSATMPTTTAAGKTHHVAFVYDSVTGKWICLAVDAVGY